MSRGRPQGRIGGLARGLSAEAGPILRERAGRASQGLLGALSSEQGRAVAIMHTKNPPTP